MSIQENTTALRSLLDIANALPNAGSGTPDSEYALKSDLETKTDTSILANGEQSMGGYPKVTIRSLRSDVNLRAVLMTPNSIYGMNLDATAASSMQKIGGSDITYTATENGQVTLQLSNWQRFKLLIISGEYDLVYSN